MAEEQLQFHRVAKRDELHAGEAMRVVVAGRELALFDVDGEIYATDNVCTHAYASLADGFVDDGTVECPLHGGRFAIRSGKALAPPAREDLPTYAVKVEGGAIYVGLPRIG